MEFKYFDTLLEAVFVITDEQKIIYCNEAGALMADISARKLMRSKPAFAEIFQFSQKIENLENLSQLTDASPYQESPFTSTSGKTGRVQLTFQNISTPETKQYLVFFRDVTLEETLQRKYRLELEKTEAYARNLEKMVDERTAEIKKLNQLLKALLDSLGQGFFAFDSSGKCLEVYSRACEQIVEAAPYQKMAWDVLKLKDKEHNGFKRWMTTIFSEMLPFEDLAPLGPQRFPHSEGKEVKLEYFPLRNTEAQIEGVVVVATDITELVQAQKLAETESAHVQMILSLLKNRAQTHRFIQEAQSLIAELEVDLQKENSCEPDSLFRTLHTLKGGAATYSIKPVTEACHHSESLLNEWKSIKTNETWTTLAEVAQQIPQLFQDFLKTNAPILGKVDRYQERWIEFPFSYFKTFSDQQFAHLPNLKTVFNEHFLSEPLSVFFESFNEVLQAVAEITGKSVGPLQIETPELKVLSEPYANLLATFVHAFRNAVDHGIETSASRLQSGKPADGQISVAFRRYKKGLLFQIKDDGAGIDPQKIRTKLLAKGLAVATETNQQVVQHIFDSQFSTKDQLSEISGRGVGMDAIRYAAEALGGKVWVKSKLGKGTKLYVHVPWIDGLAAAGLSAKPIQAA